MLGHDVETIRDYEHGQFIYRHGEHRFAWPMSIHDQPYDAALIRAYERSIDEWLELVHHRLVATVGRSRLTVDQELERAARGSIPL